MRKIVTFYQILDALRTNRELTRDTVDVALRWGEYCQMFYRASKDKPFFPRIRSIVVEKLTVTPNVNVAAASSYRPSFEELEYSFAIVVVTVLRNSFVSKDLFSYVISLTSESAHLEKIVVGRISQAAIICGRLDNSRAIQSNDLEVQMTTTFLVELAMCEDHNAIPFYETDEMKSFLRNKIGDILKEKKGPVFVVRLLLWMNSDEYESYSIRGDGAIRFLTEVLTGFLVNNRGLFDVPIDTQLLHQLCLNDTRFVKLYVEHLKSRSDGSKEESKERVDFLKQILAANGKHCADLDDTW